MIKVIFGKKEVLEKNVGSYLFEIFKLEPAFSDHFNISNDSNVSMVDFVNAHYPKSIYLDNLEKVLFPYLKAKKSLTKNVLQYKELIEELDKTTGIENLRTDEKAELKSNQEALPNIIIKIKEDGKLLAEMEGKINAHLSAAKKSCEEHSKEFKQKQIAAIYNILDNLKIPREQFKDKKIDNPLNFTSYHEAMDYIDRQTTVKKENIPIKNLAEAEHNDEIFQQLLVYLALIDCLLPLGIDYGK